MEMITFPCSKCQKAMRISADKAGKKAKCSKCGQSLVIPAQSQPLNGANQQARIDLFGDEGATQYKFADEPAPLEDLKDKKQKTSMEDLYGLDEDKDEDEVDEEEEKKEAEERENRRQLTERRRVAMAQLRKAPIDFSQWEKVRLGLLLIMVGIGFLLAAVVLQKLVFLFGIPYSSEYADMASSALVNRVEEAVPGKVPTLYRAYFVIGLIGGRDLIDVNLWLYRISYLFTLMQLFCTGTGYVYCLAIPSRFGAKGIAVALFPIVGFSFILTLTLKLLPISGAYTYTMIPLLAPEAAILRSNIERSTPIHLFWSNAPFVESLLAVLLQLATFGELALFCLFLRGVALNLKDEKLEEETEPLIRLALSIGFILISFHLLINTGTTEVLINILWIVYLFAFGFYLWFLIWYLRALTLARARIAKQIRIYGGDVAGEDEDEEEDEDDDDEEEDDDD